MKRPLECRICPFQGQEEEKGCLLIDCSDCKFFGGYIKGLKKVIINGEIIDTSQGYCNKYQTEIFGIDTCCETFKCSI